MLVVSEAMSTRGGAVVNHDVLYRLRLRLLSLAAELDNVPTAPCSTTLAPVSSRHAADLGLRKHAD